MVTVERIAGRNREIRVTVTDPHAKSFFGKMLRDELEIKRSSRAEFVSQIELGSKLNALGTGNLPPGWAPGNSDQKFWLAVNGFCTAKEDGDRFASAFEGTRSATTSTCAAPAGGNAMKNAEFPGNYAVDKRPAYGYTVDIPCPTVGQDPCMTARTENIIVDAYNPYFDPSNLGIDRNTVNGTTEYDLFGYSQVTTNFRIYNPEGDSIAGNPDIAFGSCIVDGCVAQGVDNTWRPLFTIPPSVGSGKFRIEVSTLFEEANSYGSNAFSLVAYNQSMGRNPCGNPNCPTLSGERSMSVYANAAAAGPTDFYLAKLAPARYFRGKRVQVLLWDPGEGAQSLQIIQPDGLPAPLKYRTWNPGLEDLTGNPSKVLDYNRVPATNTPSPLHQVDVSGLAASLPPGEKPPWPLTERAGTSTYNGRLLSVELTVPTNYGCAPSISPCQEIALPDDGWWKIRYTTAGAVSDRTTWSVQLLGDPVHLVKNS